MSKVRHEFTPYYRSESNMKIGYTDTPADRRYKQCTLVFCIMAILVSITMIIVGSIYAAPLRRPIYDSGCPGETMLPWYLVIAGIITIALVLIRILIIQCCDVCRGNDGRGWKEVGCTVCRVSFITLYDILAVAGTTLWLIAGTKFLLGLHDVVNFATHRPNQDILPMLLLPNML
ncbi:uncharacterized protein LOC111711029 isoform X2 [Eurytemora carolleeae]|uniref:uncharacterized protein LOC111711029 isoform X2 n=1 Tax=Eurytemora carolleeae TaxID=1294199 RepID=UPI000C794AC4|nr:uncharacterized protein LOC111711029 isoform X2 [Eurytemora carolleeae]|eukprot:XP_023341023.1 uncharacterized protein LOC111711029 isoform X2 [Eurytemora affinis]